MRDGDESEMRVERRDAGDGGEAGENDTDSREAEEETETHKMLERVAMAME